MDYNEMLLEVSKSTNLAPIYINKVYRAYWKAVREHIEELPLKEDLSDSAFEALQPNVNIPSLGKLYVTQERYKRIKEHFAQNNKKYRI